MVLPLILIDAKGVFLLRILNWYCTQAYIQVKMSGLNKWASSQVCRHSYASVPPLFCNGQNQRVAYLVLVSDTLIGQVGDRDSVVGVFLDVMLRPFVGLARVKQVP